jgi:hypothetical protein
MIFWFAYCLVAFIVLRHGALDSPTQSTACAILYYTLFYWDDRGTVMEMHNANSEERLQDFAEGQEEIREWEAERKLEEEQEQLLGGEVLDKSENRNAERVSRQLLGDQGRLLLW